MKTIVGTFVAILVFFAVLSFNASASEMDQAVAHQSSANSQIIIGGKQRAEEFKQVPMEMINVDVVFVRQSLVARY